MVWKVRIAVRSETILVTPINERRQEEKTETPAAPSMWGRRGRRGFAMLWEALAADRFSRGGAEQKKGKSGN